MQLRSSNKTKEMVVIIVVACPRIRICNVQPMYRFVETSYTVKVPIWQWEWEEETKECPRQVPVWQTCSRVHIKRIKHIKHISNKGTADSQAPLHNTNESLNGIQTHRMPPLRMLAWTGNVSSNWQRKRMWAMRRLGALGMQGGRAHRVSSGSEIRAPKVNDVTFAI